MIIIWWRREVNSLFFTLLECGYLPVYPPIVTLETQWGALRYPSIQPTHFTSPTVKVQVFVPTCCCAARIIIITDIPLLMRTHSIEDREGGAPSQPQVAVLRDQGRLRSLSSCGKAQSGYCWNLSQSRRRRLESSFYIATYTRRRCLDDKELFLRLLLLARQQNTRPYPCDKARHRGL